MLDCVFCDRIKKGQFDDWRGAAFRTSTAWFSPLNPVTVGHKLFVSAEHISDASENPHIAGRVFEAAAWYAQQREERFNLITSAGTDATQTIWHYHVHYVPRRKGDGLLLPWSNQQLFKEHHD